MNLTRSVFAVLLLLLAACVSSQPRSGAQHVTLIYSGNMNGELEPCGCSEGGDFGGVKRRATQLASLRQDNTALVVISTGGLVAHESTQDRLRSEYLLKGLATMNYDAVAVQWQDVAFGTQFISAVPLPWVASNWQAGEFAKARIIERAGVLLEFFSWLDPEQDPAAKMQATAAKVSADTHGLLESLKAAKSAGRVTLLSTAYPLEQIKNILPLTDVDVLLIQSAHEVYGEPQQLGGTLVLQPGSRGMRLGRVDLELAGNHIKTFKHEVIPLPKSVPDAAYLSAWYDEYNSRVKEEYLKRSAIRKALRSGDSPYAGADVCAQCHQSAHQIWLGSEHAKAFGDLEAVGKSFDPDCIKCHTVGFERDGGFIDLAMSGNLVNVQCENCHGAGQAHVAAGGTQPLGNKGWAPQQMCAQCHVDSHSPDFNFERYWPKITHGK